MLELAGIAVSGESSGGLGTSIELPGWDLLLDIGVCPRQAVFRGRVLVSHGHMDHLGSIALHCATRSLFGLSPPTYVVPAPLAPLLLDLLAVWRRLDGSELRCHVVPVEPGDRIALGASPALLPREPTLVAVPSGVTTVAEAVNVRHHEPSLGYVIRTVKNKLKAEYHGYDGNAIRDLRLQGVAVAEAVWADEVAWLGDTLIDALDELPLLYMARVLVLECTFLDDRVSVEACRAKGHVHLDEIVARADRFANQAILLTHFSARYTHQEIREILDHRLPESLSGRVVALLPR
jgi:ribonuclease Z